MQIPQRLVTDLSTTASRTAWALQTAREFAPNPELRSRAALADGVGRAAPVHRSQVGRWESGSTAVQYDQVRRYETVLGLPEHQLVCLLDHLHRDSAPARPHSALRIAKDGEIALWEPLLDRALSTDRMRGIYWDLLTAHITAAPNFYLRQSDWRDMVQRCVREMEVATSLEYGLRAEAVARLASHRRSVGVVTELVDTVLGRPDALIYSETACLLQFSPDPAAPHTLVRHLLHPVNPQAWQWSAAALTTLIRRGRAQENLLRTAADSAWQMVQDESAPPGARLAAAALIRCAEQRLGGDRRSWAATEQPSGPTGRVLHNGAPADTDRMRRIERHIDTALTQRFDSRVDDSTVLRDLLRDLNTVERQARGHVLEVLELSPYGEFVADAYLAELPDAVAHGSAEDPHDILAVACALSRPRHVPLLMAELRRPGVSAQLINDLGVAIGNSGSRTYGDEIAALARQHITAGGPESALIARGLTYALGMAGERDRLRQLRQETTDPGWVTALAWWLDVPEHIAPE